MSNILNSIPFFAPKRNSFRLSNEHRTTNDFFRIGVSKVIEAYPDDVMRLRSECFVRVSPLVAPVMHRFDVRHYWFFVPDRIIWDGFEDFMASKPTREQISLAAPKITFTGNGMLALFPKTLGNYMQCNIGLAPEDQATPNSSAINKANSLHPNGLTVSQLPFRAYQKIINDWFLAGSVSEPNEVPTGDDDIILDVNPNDPVSDEQKLAASLTKVRFRSWQQDYFTSCLPDPQRGPEVMAFEGASDGMSIVGSGNTSVNVPQTPLRVRYRRNGNEYLDLGSLIIANYADFGLSSQEAATQYVQANRSEINGLHDLYSVGYLAQLSQNGALRVPYTIGTHTVDIDLSLENQQITGSVSNGSIAQNLSISGGSSPGVSVEELRIRLQMQQYLERENVAQGAGAGRYTQTLYAHWGVKGKDGRLQRAEFIGSQKQPLMISEISQLSAPTSGNPLGQMAGQGVSSYRGARFKYRVPEHGFVIGLFCITPRSAYMQGLPKFWTKFDRLDFYFPEFAHVGEEPVFYRELVNNGFNGDGIFGYNLRNADLKVSYDIASGDMAGSLAHWSAARAFATPVDADHVPKLSPPFVQPTSSDVDDVDRIFPVQNSAFETTNADHFVCDIYSHVECSRLMPRYSTPRVG